MALSRRLRDDYELTVCGAVSSWQSSDTTAMEAFSRTSLTALYFGARWCPPCRNFMTTLPRYKCEDIQFCYVSRDSSESEFDTNTRLLGPGWVAIPYSDEDTRDSLAQAFNITGIPTLIIFDHEGNVITTEGRAAWTRFGQHAIQQWKSKASQSCSTGLSRSVRTGTSPAAKAELTLGASNLFPTTTMSTSLFKDPRTRCQDAARRLVNQSSKLYKTVCANPKAVFDDRSKQQTKKALCQLELDLKEVYRLLGLECKELATETTFQSSLVHCCNQIKDLIEAMRQCRTTILRRSFMGSDSVKMQAERVEELVDGVKANFNLKMNLNAQTHIHGSSGSDTTLSTQSPDQIDIDVETYLKMLVYLSMQSRDEE